ncbi:MAG TPA: hydrolase, partial [Streptomyces sp.]|nr:hydrolase [Streptomyces sp.]
MHTPAPTTGARPPATAYDAVLCDLDNVVRYYDLTRVTALEQAAGLPEGTTAGLAY